MNAIAILRFLAGWLFMAWLWGFWQPPAALGETKATDAHGALTKAGQNVRIQVVYSPMADALHLAEELSLWRPGMSRQVYKAFEEKFGIDETTNGLLKRFAPARSKIEDKVAKTKPDTTFDAPLGKEGLFPPTTLNVAEQFWETVISANTPDELVSPLDEMVEPADAEAISALLSKLKAPWPTMSGLAKLATMKSYLPPEMASTSASQTPAAAIEG